MFKRSGGSGKSPILPTTTAATSNGGDHKTSAAPPKNPKRHRRPKLGTPYYGDATGGAEYSSSRPAAAGCSNFLLGGQYYPGKDKSRSHHSNRFLLRRRSLFYRMFCSSPPRMGASILVALYVVFIFVLVPIFGVIIDLGRSLAGGGGGTRVAKFATSQRTKIRGDGGVGSTLLPPDLDGRNYPSLKNIKLRPIEEAKEETMKLYEAMKKIRQTKGGHDPILETLEDLVPDWLHRNDPLGSSGDRGSGIDGDVESMEDDEEARAVKDEVKKNVVVDEGAAGDNADGGDDDVDGNPEEGIDAVDVDDDIDEARGDDAVQEPEKETKGGVGNAKNPSEAKKPSEAEKAAKAAAAAIGVVGDAKKPSEAKQETKAAAAANPSDAIVAKAQTKQQEEARPQRSLQNMYDLPPSSSCPADLSPDDISTTLVIQCSLNRVNLLVETCNRWEGSIVLSLFLADEAEEEEWSGRQSNWEEMCPQMTVIPHLANEMEREDGAYPVNMLRNIGLDAVETSHVMMMDVDFVPSVDLYGTIGDVLSARHQWQKMEGGKEDNATPNNSGERDALIVPAFERKPPKPCKTIEECQQYIKNDSNFIPQSIDGLRDCAKSKDCIVFQSDNNWEGHHTTHSDQWLKGDWYDDGDYRELESAADVEGDGDGEWVAANVAAGNNKKKEKRGRRKEKIDLGRKIKSVKCFDSLRYEPWVVVRWCPSFSSQNIEKGDDGSIRPVAPYFDERFHGYGKNKIEMTSHLRFLGYDFSILPLSFIIHQPHPESKAKRVWMDGEKDLHYDMDSLYPKFLRELAHRYDGGKSALPTCERPKKGKKNKKETNKQEEKVKEKDADVAAAAAAAEQKKAEAVKGDNR